jgi:hypothetical protein
MILISQIGRQRWEGKTIWQSWDSTAGHPAASAANPGLYHLGGSWVM